MDSAGCMQENLAGKRRKSHKSEVKYVGITTGKKKTSSRGIGVSWSL